MDYLLILLKTLFFYFAIVLFYRFMGKREVGELGIIDLIVSVLIAELAAISIEKYDDSVFLMFIPIIHGLENGKIYVWYIIFAAWGTDVFAYVVGKWMGKHKFSSISPNKTIEGCIGGALGAVLMILVYTWVINTYWDMHISYLTIGIIGLVLSIIGQIGDFSASSIKRYVGIKDFSNLIPGHGGLLDRIDSIIFIAPFAYFLFMFIR